MKTVSYVLLIIAGPVIGALVAFYRAAAYFFALKGWSASQVLVFLTAPGEFTLPFSGSEWHMRDAIIALVLRDAGIGLAVGIVLAALVAGLRGKLKKPA